jgi:hypothetical protein
VRECASLLATSLSFRGYALRNEVTVVSGQIRRTTIRTLLTGALIHTTDHLKPPADLVLSAQAGPDAVVISLEVRMSEGDKGFSNEATYRKLDWNDFQALAAAEGVELQREDKALRMTIPFVQPR